MGDNSMAELAALPGLGPESAKWLVEAGIDSPERLRELGAVKAFHRVAQVRSKPPSLNLLYALEGAIQMQDWREIAVTERERLQTELDAYRELEQMMNGRR